ncbi:MAG: hypothetical protein R6X19_07610 [Kiritimatiellia bacterium]
MNERSRAMRARLAEVERELERLAKQRKTLQKRRLRDLPGDLGEPRAPISRGLGAAPPLSAAPVAAPEKSAAEPAQDPLERAVMPEDGQDRERFASYFMTGSLGRAGPQLRRERRVMRNKAVLMAVVAIILLLALVHWIT